MRYLWISLDYSRVEANPPHPNINGCEAQRMKLWLSTANPLQQSRCGEIGG